MAGLDRKRDIRTNSSLNFVHADPLTLLCPCPRSRYGIVEFNVPLDTV